MIDEVFKKKKLKLAANLQSETKNLLLRKFTTNFFYSTVGTGVGSVRSLEGPRSGER